MEQKLREYAKLLIEVGLSVREGQTLLLSTPVECAPFARLCAAAAYEAGCRRVEVYWSDDALIRARYLHADDSVFDEESEWRRHLFNDVAEDGGAYLSISARNPEALKGVDPGRIKRSRVSNYAALDPFYSALMKNVMPWCLGSVPIPSWAKKVFPELPEREAMAMLWNAIFQAVRITGDGQAVPRWNEHLATLERRRKTLDDMRLKSLHYTNERGTDLTVELPEGHRWTAGRLTSPQGQGFVPNMPTEEIFTAPRRDGVNGIVIASLPMTVNSNIIDKFRLIVKNGKVVEAYAEKGQDVLRSVLATDENACYFGEVALVPYDSPVSRQGILYYHTLFDENARCHIALGRAYPDCVEGGEQMTKEELMAHGLNQSVVHSDFMVGTQDLSITGTLPDGREIPIFVNGNFAL